MDWRDPEPLFAPSQLDLRLPQMAAPVCAEDQNSSFDPFHPRRTMCLKRRPSTETAESQGDTAKRSQCSASRCPSSGKRSAVGSLIWKSDGAGDQILLMTVWSPVAEVWLPLRHLPIAEPAALTVLAQRTNLLIIWITTPRDSRHLNFSLRSSSHAWPRVYRRGPHRTCGACGSRQTSSTNQMHLRNVS